MSFVEFWFPILSTYILCGLITGILFIIDMSKNKKRLFPLLMAFLFPPYYWANIFLYYFSNEGKVYSTYIWIGILIMTCLIAVFIYNLVTKLHYFL
jgi:hypothetical protein